MNIIETFIRYLFEKSESIDEGILEIAEDCRLDYLGVVTAGAERTKKQWAEYPFPEGTAFLYGYDKKTDSKTAAFINGFNAHALELDDGQRFAMIHLGAVIISAIDAVRYDYSVLRREALKGIIMGYEAACRIAIAMQPSHKQKGYHTAGTCGTIGAAVGVAFALKMDEKQVKQVLTAAAASSAGMLEIQEQGSELKPYNIGRAAMDGVAAAYMGFTKFEIPEDMLGGARGFFKVFSDEWSVDKLVGDKDYFEIQRIYVKPYASCRHSHSAVEAAIKIGKRIQSGEVESVLVETYQLGVKGHNYSVIKGIASAKLSTPYAVAAALIYGKADVTVFEPLDRDVMRLAKKVNVIENPLLTAESPQKRVAIVHVRLKDGKEETERVDYAKGDPENPMNRDEIIRKVEELVGRERAKQFSLLVYNHEEEW